MTTINVASATSGTISQLLQKLGDADPDFRFMSLNDLLNVLVHGRPEILQNDFNTAARTIDHLVRALDDQNGEVQNLAIKCLGPLVRRLPNSIIGPLMEKLAVLKLKNSVDAAIPALALKAVVESLPCPTPGEPPAKDVTEAYALVSRVLIPRFVSRSSARNGNFRATPTQLATAQAGGSGSGSLLDPSKDLVPESVDVLIAVVRCFGPLLQPLEAEALQDTVVNVLHDARGSSVVKKRAVAAISILAVYLPDEALASFVSGTVQTLGSSSSSPATQRLYISILGSMARSIPHRFDNHIAAVAPFILHALDEAALAKQLEAVSEGNDSSDFNDVRETALVTLDAFLCSCPNQMRPYTDETIQACLRYVRYDPNYVDDEDDGDDGDDGDDDEMDDAGGDDDEDEDEDDDAGFDDDEFEADAGFDDDDDASWKVRRCAAKAIHTLISTRSSGDLLENGVLYREAAPVLIKRFDEREETVRLEVISALALLVRKSGSGILPDFPLDDQAAGDFAAQLPLSRKRRRQSSASGATAAVALSRSGTAGPLSPTLERTPSIPTSGPRADLAAKTPAIVRAAAKLLKGKQIPTKHAVVCLLDDIVTVQHGGMSDYFGRILPPVIEAVKPSSVATSASSLSLAGGNATATPATLRVAALHLVGHVANTHPSQVLQPYLPSIVDGVLSVAYDRFYKISGEAMSAIEEVAKTITPPRSRTVAAAKFKPELQKLYDVIMNRTTSADVDAEVRRKAIRALGTLLSRTGTAGGSDAASGGLLLPLDKRSAALDALQERLSNETSRLAAVEAIDVVTAAATASAVPFDAQWTRSVAVELSTQLRKANRTLRGSSVQALRHLVQSPAAKGLLDADTVGLLVAALQPVLTNGDVLLLSPALRILEALVQEEPTLVVTPGVIASLCTLLQTNVAATVLDRLLALVTAVGRSGQGQALMGSLLRDVGVHGDPAVVGKVVGNLLVASGASAGVTVDSFVKEVQTSKGDQMRASLALSVLGEAGLRLGAASPIQPSLFLEQFGSAYDKVAISAAVALGRAGAGNVAVYLPVILDGMGGSGETQYLLLQSTKEVLQQVAVDQTDISAYAATIWEHLLRAADVENNKAVCAECIGRLAIIAPQTYIPKLKGLLQDARPVLRAMAVQALRYTLPETGEAFDALLRENLVTMLTTALQDADMEIRRLAMTALNAAANNKPELVLAHLDQLLPYIMEESRPKPELVREVQMGPFKHTVDDGLEVRKGAYETLYALMETALSRISVLRLFERVVDGLSDDHDIRALCNLMLARLAYVAPEATARHLDAIADKYRVILSTKLKDNAVKQELEKQDDANKSVLRATLLLADRLKATLSDGSSTLAGDLGRGRGSGGGAGANGGGAGANGGSSSSSKGASSTGTGGGHQQWAQYWEWVNKAYEPQLRSLREENRELGTSLGY